MGGTTYRDSTVALSDKISPKDLAQSLNVDHSKNSQIQRLYPVLDDKERLVGVVTRKDLQEFIQSAGDGNAAAPGGEKVGTGPLGVPHNESSHIAELIHTHPVVAYPDEPLRAVVYRMAETGFTRFPVVERDNPQQLVGMISLNDLLKARVRNLEEERRRERVLRMRLFFPSRVPHKV